MPPNLSNVTTPCIEKSQGTTMSSDSILPPHTVNSRNEKKLKCVFIGDGSVGKTSLVVSYTTDQWNEKYFPTQFDNYSVVVTVDEAPIRLDICDTAGQDDFDNLRPLCYPGTDVFLLCFSVVSPTSFHNVSEKWLPEIRKHSPKVPVILVGTQSDLRSDVNVLIDLARFAEKPVTPEDALARAQRMNAVGYIECSALTQHNMKEVFDRTILTGLHYKYPGGSQSSAKSRSLKKCKKTNPTPKQKPKSKQYHVSDSEQVKRGWKKICCFL